MLDPLIAKKALTDLIAQQNVSNKAKDYLDRVVTAWVVRAVLYGFTRKRQEAALVNKLRPLRSLKYLTLIAVPLCFLHILEFHLMWY